MIPCVNCPFCNAELENSLYYCVDCGEELPDQIRTQVTQYKERLQVEMARERERRAIEKERAMRASATKSRTAKRPYPAQPEEEYVQYEVQGSNEVRTIKSRRFTFGNGETELMADDDPFPELRALEQPMTNPTPAVNPEFKPARPSSSYAYATSSTSGPFIIQPGFGGEVTQEMIEAVNRSAEAISARWSKKNS